MTKLACAYIGLGSNLNQPAKQLQLALEAIENQQGRVRNIRWGARTLDLDLLIYEDCVLRTDRLTIPHPEIANRRFVLQPLYDLAPALSLPSGEAIADLLDNCTADELVAYQHAY